MTLGKKFGNFLFTVTLAALIAATVSSVNPFGGVEGFWINLIFTVGIGALAGAQVARRSALVSSGALKPERIGFVPAKSINVRVS